MHLFDGKIDVIVKIDAQVSSSDGSVLLAEQREEFRFEHHFEHRIIVFRYMHDNEIVLPSALEAKEEMICWSG